MLNSYRNPCERNYFIFIMWDNYYIIEIFYLYIYVFIKTHFDSLVGNLIHSFLGESFSKLKQSKEFLVLVFYDSIVLLGLLILTKSICGINYNHSMITCICVASLQMATSERNLDIYYFALWYLSRISVKNLAKEFSNFPFFQYILYYIWGRRI